MKKTHQSHSPDAESALCRCEAPGRLKGYGPVSIIDIGSNSVRLVIYERQTRAPTMLFNEKILAGLGKGLAATGRMEAESVEQALAAIRRFKMLADQSQSVATYILATAASRDASNGQEFLKAVEDICGVKVNLLSGADEARLSAMGVRSGVNEANGIVGDLGGGSLELVRIENGAIGVGRTFPIGGLRLSEAAEGSIRKAEKIVAEALEAAAQQMPCAGLPFYAVGGTWRSLAHLHMFETGYPLHVMHGYTIPAEEALEFARIIARRDLETIDQIDVVSKSRRGLLPYGALVMEQVIRAIRPAHVVISALGVREGYLYEHLSEEERARDPLLEACRELNLVRSRSPRHAEELIPWSAAAFAALGIDETPDEQRLRAAGCLVSDIGWRAHPDYRGEQSLGILANAAFVGVDHPGRAYLALAVFYRHVGLVDDAVSPRIRELASTRLKERARILGAVLRVAYLVSAAMHGVIPRTRIYAEGDCLVLELPTNLGDLVGERLSKRLVQLAKVGGLRDAVIRVVG
ncbi:Ppx/GppA phosphatase family protein [Oryzibacter oryziterrae]|uniref:Ppx/GppA phosphatase family protein n=1 Tax=Oryzibacter oryziterrae TaxID=2766474 RepID=UPI0021055B8D|nr:Ppx/GppA phosphatase family protein [Oryzibacter oryziterrae]